MPIKPWIETTKKPWFGPRKRARKWLSTRQQVLPPKDTWEILKELLGKLASNVQGIRFIDYTHSGEQFYYTIALIWTYSDTKTREELYNLAPRLVAATGWYPLPQGERIFSRQTIGQWNALLGETRIPQIDLGKQIKGISSAVDSDGGCSVRIHTNKGNLLFDAGLPDHLKVESSDEAVFISHLHRDHIGGVENGSTGSLPVILPYRTAHILLSQGRLNIDDIGSKFFIISPEASWQQVNDVLEIKAFQVPHAPGSVGYAIRDSSDCIIYSGDIVLRTKRHDIITHLNQIIQSVDRKNITLLLDATMASRSAGASDGDTAEQMLTNLEQVREIAVVSRDAEQLLYAYLDMYHLIHGNAEHRHTVDFLITPALKPLFAVIHSAFIGRELTALDPLLAAQYGTSMSAWAESRFLYWLDTEHNFINNYERKVIWFLTQRELDQFTISSSVKIAVIGKYCSSDLRGYEQTQIDTSPWTLHSNRDSLLSAIDAVDQSINIVLFHDFPKRLRKFVRAENLTVGVLSKELLTISTTDL